MTLALAPIDFVLPRENIASKPIESTPGLDRDDVRMMVVHRSIGTSHDTRFSQLPSHLSSGDVLVINTSKTIPAAVKAIEDPHLMVHFATPSAAGLWNVELRRARADGGTEPWNGFDHHDVRLPGGAIVHLLAQHPRSKRLWVAALDGVADLLEYLGDYGSPIRYEPGAELPIDAYQTVFATEPGSVEMPSAARPFTNRLVTALINAGVSVAPILLHSGVSSYESGETPADEWFSVSGSTATSVNALRASGGRVIAVGTTVARALESVVDDRGTLHPGRGFTDVVITGHSGVRAVDGLITGWHEPRSSHLSLLEAFLDRPTLGTLYDRAVSVGYQWHEFGDSMLILP